MPIERTFPSFRIIPRLPPNLSNFDNIKNDWTRGHGGVERKGTVEIFSSIEIFKN